MGRVVEFDLANERIVLATMIHVAEERRRLSFSLRASEFGDDRHRILFRGLSKMARAGLAWNEDTLADICGDEDFGGFKYIRAIEEDYDSNRNLDYHVERLRLDSAKFQVMAENLPSIAEACEDPTAPSERVLGPLREAVARMERQGRSFVHSGETLADGYYQTLRMRAATGGYVDGTGFPILDTVFARGWHPGWCSVVVGRPGHGKTTFVANLLRERMREGKGTYVCAWEMDPEDYIDMMVSAETGIPSLDLARNVGGLTKEQKEEIRDVVELYRDSKLIEFEENPFPHLEPPTSRWDVNERNLDFFEGTLALCSSTKPLVILDVIGKALFDRRPDAITQALIRLRGMAKKYGVHILALHHLNREGADGPPNLKNIKHGGAFEEEMDNVFGLDRPILRASPARRRKMVDHLDVHVLKQRKGPAPACIRYRFDGPRFALSDEVEVDLSSLEVSEEDDAG